MRVLHFLALAYLVLSLIEPYRQRLDRGAGHLLILIGRQSLAAFLASVVLARLLGTVAEMAGRSEPVIALLNLTGFALILGVAVVVGWFKSAPWAKPTPRTEAQPQAEPVATAPPTRVREAS
ncbi:OpgC domain-containing protein [Bosea vestrisii]|uniref:OpgC domain-containing protein n=1 Tax=Bosea vestrisii TaxID=151416 RepID=UPI003D767104